MYNLRIVFIPGNGVLEYLLIIDISFIGNLCRIPLKCADR